jgi:uncharacterized protein (DUF58 family)
MQLLENQEVRNLGNLELLANQVVEGFIVGLHKSPFHGFSVEFAEHRLYNPGESTRNIDWKVYARSEKLFTKKFEEETNLRCQIVIDGSSTMFYPYDEKDPKKYQYENKLAFSGLAAASLMNLLKKQRDAFGLTIFDEEIRSHTGAKSSSIHYRALISQLTQLIESQQLGRNTGAAKALHQIAESVHRRSLVVIFSDMFESSEDPESLFSALQHLKHNKHEVILFHVVDKSHEVDFEFENRPYVFVDMETNEQVRLQPNQVKTYYKEQVAKFNEQLKMKCLQYKIDFVEADIKAGFKPILQQYLVKRSRMGI